MIFEKRNIQFERDKRQVPNDADELRAGREREGQGDVRLMLQAVGSGRVSLCKEQLPSGVI